MQAEFWHDRWSANKIGFHLDAVNPYLVQYWPEFHLTRGSRVFVPLCGKTLDMLWLAEQGHEVVGVEISPIAVQAFFRENRLNPHIEQQGAFEIWSVDQITLICGDFFELTPHQLGEVSAVYDRAALVALPVDMRPDYIEHMHALCATLPPQLLITLEYEQTKMDGPPFSVSADEVQSLFSPHYEIRQLATTDVLDENDRFREQGLKSLMETVWEIKA